jgi:hypothetical protein
MFKTFAAIWLLSSPVLAGTWIVDGSVTDAPGGPGAPSSSSADGAWITNRQSGVTLGDFTATGFLTAANGRIYTSPWEVMPGDLGYLSFIGRVSGRAFTYFDLNVNNMSEYSFELDPVSESLRWNSSPGRTWMFPADSTGNVVASRAYVDAATNGLAARAWVSSYVASNVPSSGYTMQYPVFNIPLNGSQGWSDFELKASTNNFKPTDPPNNLLLWYESLGTVSFPEWGAYKHADLNAQTFFSNPDASGFDGRSWILATNTLSLTEQIGANGNYQESVVCIPSFTVKDGGTNTWMYPENERLVWAYRRRTAAYGETNGSGRALWHPIVPSQWRRTPMSVDF